MLNVAMYNVAVIITSIQCLFPSHARASLWPGGGVLPYMAYMGMCHWTGYGFWPHCPEQGIQFYARLSSINTIVFIKYGINMSIVQYLAILKWRHMFVYNKGVFIFVIVPKQGP